MKIKHLNISPEVMAVLKRSTITETSLTLPVGHLERSLYEAVNKIIAAVGGKWNKKAQAHLFPSDPREALGLAIGTGKVVNHKQTYQFFPTPREIVNKMLTLADIENGMTLLEPSAGSGAIIRAIRDSIGRCDVTAIEIEPKRADELAQTFHMAKVIEANFLLCHPPKEKFDRVVMNPPFTAGQDVRHIQHALTFLRPGGRLVAICSAGPKAETALKPLSCYWEILPENAFKESGTSIKTVLLMIEGDAA